MMKEPNSHLTTELFKGRAMVPDFIKQHHLFQKPTKIQKVFPAIGLPNFKEEAKLDKCLVDVKKEGTYVYNMLKVMSDILNSSRESLQTQADRFQYLMSKADREKQKGKVQDIYNLCGTMAELQSCCDPMNREVLDGAIQTEDSRIVLRLMKDITLGEKKHHLKKGEALFRAFNKIGARLTEIGVQSTAIETTDQHKIFGRENVPNKSFLVSFSSTGPEGAWDLLTMSMRGFKSCQRWNGEYPKCLIGSIVSKFVGIIYLTSGVEAPPPEGFTQSFGTKMMRRCVVRYAVDADDDRPCIIVDKMYPSGEEVDRDILKLFMDAIKSRTNLPVYYAPDTTDKMRHIYMPYEKIREEVLSREWSYQDTPIKSKHDLFVLLLNFDRDEVERELKGFKVNLSLYIARQFENIYSNNISVDSEVKKTIGNVRMNTSFTPVCDQIVDQMLAYFRRPLSAGYSNSRSYYRKYLTDFIVQRKRMMDAYKPGVQDVITQNTSRTFDNSVFVEYVSRIATDFAREEIKRLIH